MVVCGVKWPSEVESRAEGLTCMTELQFVLSNMSKDGEKPASNCRLPSCHGMDCDALYGNIGMAFCVTSKGCSRAS